MNREFGESSFGEPSFGEAIFRRIVLRWIVFRRTVFRRKWGSPWFPVEFYRHFKKIIILLNRHQISNTSTCMFRFQIFTDTCRFIIEEQNYFNWVWLKNFIFKEFFKFSYFFLIFGHNFQGKFFSVLFIKLTFCFIFIPFLPNYMNLICVNRSV